jgi:hypothetical protein
MTFHILGSSQSQLTSDEVISFSGVETTNQSLLNLFVFVFIKPSVLNIRTCRVILGLGTQGDTTQEF